MLAFVLGSLCSLYTQLDLQRLHLFTTCEFINMLTTVNYMAIAHLSCKKACQSVLIKMQLGCKPTKSNSTVQKLKSFGSQHVEAYANCQLNQFVC